MSGRTFRIPLVRSTNPSDINESIRNVQVALDQIDAWLTNYGASYSGPYQSGETYPKGTIMGDGQWVVIANKDTSEYPYPQPVGEPVWVVYGAPPPTLNQASTTSWSLTKGHRYTFTTGGYLLAIRFHSATDNGQNATIRQTVTIDGISKQTILAEKKLTRIGWEQFPQGMAVVPSGATIQHDAIYTNDSNAVDTPANYNYQMPVQDRVSVAGEIAHSDRSLNQLHVNKTDADSTDRSALLDDLLPGDTITGVSVTWTILSILSTDANEVIFEVQPQLQELNIGVQSFTFRKFGAAALFFGRLSGALTPFPGIDSYSATGGSAGSYNADLGLGWDVQLQEASIPNDWDILRLP